MDEVTYFGYSSINFRSESGALLGRELEKIYDFFMHRGLLVAECFDTYIILSHPDLFSEIETALKETEVQSLLIASNLHSLREQVSLSIFENRIMEALCPCALVLDGGISHIPVAIPDSFDLRDMCSLYGGTLHCLIIPPSAPNENNHGLEHGLKLLKNIDIRQYGFSRIGILESPNYDGDYPPSKITKVRVDSKGEVNHLLKGDVQIERINEVLKRTSIWEIEEWT